MRSIIYRELENNEKLSQEQIVEIYSKDEEQHPSTRQVINNIQKKLEDLEIPAERRMLIESMGTNEQKEELKNNDLKIFELKSKKRKLEELLHHKTDNLLYATSGHTPAKKKYPSKEIRNKIFLGTIDIVIFYTNRYFYRTDNTISYDDLFQVASMSLLSACNYYVPNNEATFRTYASKCIDNQLKSFIYKKKRKHKKDKNINRALKLEFDYIAYLEEYLSLKILHHGHNRSIIEDLKKFIREKNKRALNLGEPYRILNKKVNDLNYEIHANKLTKKFTYYIKTSPMKVLITDEDRDLISLEAERQNIESEYKDTWRLLQYVSLYKKRLEEIYNYLKVEKELTKEGFEVIPKEEILKRLNLKIKEFNSLVFYYRTNKKDIPMQETAISYYDEYCEQFGVDFLDMTGESRAKEKDEISGLFEFHNLEDEYKIALENLNGVDPKKNVNYSYFEVEDSQFTYLRYINDYTDEDYGDEINEYCQGTYPYKSTVLELKTLIEQTLKNNKDGKLLPRNEKEAIEFVLNKRKEFINTILEEKNKPIYEYNKSLEIKEQAFAANGKYKKYYTITDLDRIDNYIGLLFNDNYEKMSLLLNSRDESKRVPNLSVEDEACVNAFLSDYYKALDSLDDTQKSILLLWFDSQGKQLMNAKEIAEILDIKAIDVYNEKKKAIRKLSKNTQLKSYLEII